VESAVSTREPCKPAFCLLAGHTEGRGWTDRRIANQTGEEQALHVSTVEQITGAVEHDATPRFWRCYRKPPQEVRQLADRSYALFKSDTSHRSLQFKRIGQFWSVRVGRHYRSLAIEAGRDVVWFWIGSHDEYDKLVGRQPANKRLQPTRATRRSAKRSGRARG